MIGMKKQKLSREACEAYKALGNLSEDEQQLIFRKVFQQETSEPIQKQHKEKGSCPHCGSSHVSRNGRTPSGYQRFVCVDCRRTFGEKERPVWAGSHFPREVWEEYIRLMSMGATIIQVLQNNLVQTSKWAYIL